VQSGNQRLLEIMYQTQGNFSTNNAFTVVSTATKTALIDGGLLDATDGNSSVTGSVKVQRYIPGIYGYHYLSTPTSDATVNQFSDDMSISGFSQEYEFGGWGTFWYYDETVIGQTPHPSIPYDLDNQIMMNGWKTTAGTGSALTPFVGYCALINSGIVSDVAGTVNNGSKSINLTNTVSVGATSKPEHDGWNLIGNPYPSPIDWDAATGWTKGVEVENAIYSFEATSTYMGVYKSWINGVGSHVAFTSIIPAMQSVFVRVTGNTTLTCDNRVRVADLTANSIFLKSNKKTSKQIIRLQSSSLNSNKPDETVIYFDDNATINYEGNLDARKYFNNDGTYPNFYSLSKDNTKIAIQGINNFSDSIIIPLGLDVVEGGDYIIKMNSRENIDNNKKIYLEDRLLNKFTCLDENPIYSFSYLKTEKEGRFFIKIASIIDNVKEINKESLAINAFPNPFKNELNVSYNLTNNAIVKISITDALGNNISELYNNNNQTKGKHNLKISTQNLSSGFYILKVIINDSIHSFKISKV